MRGKAARHAQIRALLEAECIETHEMLAEALAGMHIEVSQSTLSKDLRELGVVRIPRPEGGFRYTVPEVGVTPRDQRILERELRDYLVRVDRAVNLTVLKTLSGRAQGVCETIDRMDWPEIIGTIGGEDTILIISRTAKEASAIVRRIAEYGGKKD